MSRPVPSAPAPGLCNTTGTANSGGPPSPAVVPLLCLASRRPQARSAAPVFSSCPPPSSSAPRGARSLPGLGSGRIEPARVHHHHHLAPSPASPATSCHPAARPRRHARPLHPGSPPCIPWLHRAAACQVHRHLAREPRPRPDLRRQPQASPLLPPFCLNRAPASPRTAAAARPLVLVDSIQSNARSTGRPPIR